MRPRPVALLAGALAVALGLAACGGGGSDPSGIGATPGIASTTSTTEPAPVVGATAVRGRTFIAGPDDIDGYDLVADTELHLAFTDRLVTITAGCTTMTAPFDLRAGRLSWGAPPVAAPESCPGERQLQDQWVIDRLVEGVEIIAGDDGLALRSDDGEVELRLIEQEGSGTADDQPLFGTAWSLVTVVDDDVATPVPAGMTTPTLRISGSSTASFFDGCNQGTVAVSVEADGEVLRFGEPTMTGTPCSDEADALATSMLGVLDGSTLAQVNGTTLTIEKGSSALVFRAS